MNTLLDVLPSGLAIDRRRKTRWSEATEDVTGLRRLIADGPLSIVQECRTLARFALSQAIVVLEDEGNLRVSKRRKWKSRDDVAICATLAGGASSPSPCEESPRQNRLPLCGVLVSAFHHGNTAWLRVRRNVLDAENWRCRLCGGYGNEADHISSDESRREGIRKRESTNPL